MSVPDRLRHRPSRMLAQAAAVGDRIIGDALSALGARKWHYAALAALQEFGPASQAALSRTTGIYTSDLVAVVTELAGQGFVERVPDPADRRRNVVTLTAAGRRQLRRLDKAVDAGQDALLEPLTGADREELAGLLNRLLEHHSPAW